MAAELFKSANEGSGLEDTKAEVFAGVDGGTAISAAIKPAPDVAFGSIKQRQLDDAVALRQRLAGAA